MANRKFKMQDKLVLDVTSRTDRRLRVLTIFSRAVLLLWKVYYTDLQKMQVLYTSTQQFVVSTN